MKKLYKYLIPYEYRYYLYKLRHRKSMGDLRNIVYTSDKGDFSLKPFDENRCLFVHITKTAGTSIAKSLFGVLPYHYTASQYRVMYGKKTFNSYFKFAVARNPWDRLYSAFSYLKGGGWNTKDLEWANAHLQGIADFNQFVLEWMSADRVNSHIHFWPQSRFICDHKGKPIIDYLAYFENINSDFKKISQRLNIHSNLAHTNPSARSKYQDVYSPEAREKVLSIYKQDVDLLGYSFDSLEFPILQNI